MSVKPLPRDVKLGFLIYRCDYRDDSVWEYLIRRWSDIVNTSLTKSGLRDLINNLEWEIKEDRATLDGATVEDIRKIFTAWTKSKETVTERQAAIKIGAAGSPRHFYCVHVDAKALDSCLAYDKVPEDDQGQFWHGKRDPALGHGPYVTIVQKDLELEIRRYPEDGDGEEAGEDDEEDLDEVTSVKVHWESAVPHFYFSLNQAIHQFPAIPRYVDQDGVHL